MSKEDLSEKIGVWLTPLLEEKGYFLVDVKVLAGKKVEVYVDSDNGIHIDECAQVSRFLEKHLDEDGGLPANYVLEVSSPGADNPLKVARQYKKLLNKNLEIVKTNGEKITARLIAADDEKICLREEAAKHKTKKNKGKEEDTATPKEYKIAYTDIKQALLVFKF